MLGETSSTPASDTLQYSDSNSKVERRSTSQASGPFTGATSRKKRIHEEAEGAQDTPRANSSQKKSKTLHPLPDTTHFIGDIQCAHYAIERLRAAWSVTHSIVLLLDDNMLSLRWYDAEGSIVTQPIDIIGRLPLFVVMVIILQRFKAAMLGLSDIQMTENGPVSFCLESDKAKGKLFGLVGRQTFMQLSVTSVWSAATSHVLDGSKQSIAPQEPHEASDAPVITSTPLSPGLTPTLPKRWCSNRLKASNTLPNSSSSFPVPQQSSRVFPGSARQLLGLGAEPSHSLLRLVCHKLFPIKDLDVQEFWKASWELIRCHYLLWRIGVAHGDISIGNLMYDAVTEKAILND